MIVGYGIIAVPTGIVSAELVGGSGTDVGKVGGRDGRLQCRACGVGDHLDDSTFCRVCGTALD
jgi:voltage-gated potassium channel